MTKLKDQVLAKANIRDVVSEFVSLRKAGVNYIGLCPFKNEKTPSFTVSPAKGIYKCFGCGAHGDMFNFVMDIEKLEFKDALKWLATKYKIDIPPDEKEYKEREKDKEKEPYRVVTKWAINYYKSLINEGKDYLQSRGFTDEDIKEWGLGYTGSGFTEIVDHARKAGISLNLLTECGFVADKEGKYYNRLIDRVVFPYTDTTGNYTGFTARITKGDSKFAKYINSTTSLLFDKGKTLFGIDKARKAIINAGECILCEGPTDVISMHKAGINNCVCVSGTAIEVSHLQMIRRMADTLVIMLDGDKAGQAATIKSIDNAIAEGFTVYITELPDKHDPDSFIRAEGQEKAKDYILNTRVDFLEYKSVKLIEPVKDNPERLTDAIKNVADTLGLITDQLKRSVYIKRIAQKTDIAAKEIEKCIIENNLNGENDISGLFICDEARVAIEKRKTISIYRTREKVIEQILAGYEATVGILKPLTESEVKELKKLSVNLFWEDVIPDVYDKKNNETEFIVFFKHLIAQGFNFTVNCPGEPNVETGDIVNTRIDFVDYYISKNIDSLYSRKYDSKGIQKSTEKMAELVSFLGEVEQTIKINYIKSLFKAIEITFSVSEFRKVMKPYLNTQKETRKTAVTIELNNPHGLNEKQLKCLNDYGIFFKQNAIWIENQGGVKSKSNFVIYPIIHTKSSGRKLFRIVNVFGIESVINVTTQEMNNITKFMCELEAKGNYRFDGDPNDLKKLKKYLYDLTIYSDEIENLGWQQDGFWAWADGISLPDKTFQPITEFGLVNVPKAGIDTWYYIKPFSKLYTDDKNVFIQERKFRHTTSDIKFTDWCNNFIDVFGVKSVLSLAALLTTCFGDFIFARLGALPLVNIFGPKGTGKTEQAKSILSCFGEKQNEVNMTKVTPYAAAHNLKMFVNAFVLFDEYKNNLTTEWIELMKSIYNRQPRIRGTIKEGMDTIAIPVNSMIFMCGQEMPTADPALLSRCLFISEYNTQHTAAEKKKYNDFKEIDNAGKAHFIDQIVAFRNKIEQEYIEAFYAMEKDLGESVRTNTDDRIIKNYATLLTTYKLLYKELGLQIPFEKLKEISLQCMEEQMNILSTTNEIGTFWSIFQSLIDRGIIEYTKHYMVETLNEINMHVMVDGKRIPVNKEFDKKGTAILFLRWSGLYPAIAEAAKRGDSDILPEKSLLYYMQHHKSFIGFKEAKKFGVNTNQALVFNYDALCEWTGIDITKVPIKREMREAATVEETEHKIEMEVAKDGLPF